MIMYTVSFLYKGEQRNYPKDSMEEARECRDQLKSNPDVTNLKIDVERID